MIDPGAPKRIMKPKCIVLPLLLVFMAASAPSRAEETLEWRDCVGEAKRRHPDLISALEKVNQAKAEKEAARSAVMPEISGGASAVRSKTTSSGSTGTSSSASSRKNPSTSYDYSVTGQQLLFDAFKTSFDLSSAERGIESTRYNYDVTSSNIRLRLRTAFANLLSAEELLKVTESIETRRNQNLKLVRLRYEGGREHKGSLLTAEADLAQAVYDVGQARRSIYYSQRQLIK